MVDFARFNSLDSLYRYFYSDTRCRKVIEQSVWKDGVVCPFCGCVHCYNRNDGRFKCGSCGKSFSCLHGTIFDNTKVSLRKWFAAMYLVSSHKTGISTYAVARDIEVSQKTAWFMLTKIRTLFKQNDAIVLKGKVEIDEAFIGGCEMSKHPDKKTKGNQGRSLKTKAPVIGLVERGGNVVAVKTNDCKAKTIKVLVRQFVENGSTIVTDTFNGYNWLDKSEYKHIRVNHSNGFGVSTLHTNSIEGFWSLLKRAFFGIYYHVSVEHLQDYVDEVAFRYNTRNATSGERFDIMMKKAMNVVRYDDLKLIRRNKNVAA